MNPSKITLQELIASYKESLGVEGAEQLIRQVLVKACFSSDQGEFTKSEALKICRVLKQYPGFIGIVGGILNSRIMIK